MPQVSQDERIKILLRTTADMMLHALSQLECCVEEYPQYAGEVRSMRNLCDSLVADARSVGYIGRGAKGG